LRNKENELKEAQAEERIKRMEVAEKRAQEEKLALEKTLQEEAAERQKRANAVLVSLEEQRKKQMEEISLREKSVLSRLAATDAQ